MRDEKDVKYLTKFQLLSVRQFERLELNFLHFRGTSREIFNKCMERICLKYFTPKSKNIFNFLNGYIKKEFRKIGLDRVLMELIDALIKIYKTDYKKFIVHLINDNLFLINEIAKKNVRNFLDSYLSFLVKHGEQQEVLEFLGNIKPMNVFLNKEILFPLYQKYLNNFDILLKLFNLEIDEEFRGDINKRIFEYLNSNKNIGALLKTYNMQVPIDLKHFYKKMICSDTEFLNEKLVFIMSFMETDSFPSYSNEIKQALLTLNKSGKVSDKVLLLMNNYLLKTKKIDEDIIGEFLKGYFSEEARRSSIEGMFFVVTFFESPFKKEVNYKPNSIGGFVERYLPKEKKISSAAPNVRVCPQFNGYVALESPRSTTENKQSKFAKFIKFFK